MPKIIPFGDRILVRRRVIGEKVGKEQVIITPKIVEERPTDLADVVNIPEHSFADIELVNNADEIIKAHTEKAKQGDSEALIALLRYNEFLKIKSIKEGDCIMISKYVGTDFHDNKSGKPLTLVKGEDIIGLVVE